MTQEQFERIHRKAKEHAEEAHRTGTDFLFAGDPWENDSLAKVINTKEKAEVFMRQLEEAFKEADNQ
jgi:hypothetical protein